LEKIFYNNIRSGMCLSFLSKVLRRGRSIVRDLDSKIPGALNFKYKEFVKSDTAARKGIDNIPSEEHWQNIEKLAVNVLQPTRAALGRIRITSGYRSPELNIAIGGSEDSNHCKGEASDIESGEKAVSLVELLEWIYNHCEFRTLIAEYFNSDGWCHVDYREGGNLKRLRLKDEYHNYETVSLDYIKNLYNN
jgi:hypothetical protein